MKHALIIALALAACGDNFVPPPEPDAAPPIPDAPQIQTWEDAWGVWADAWCTLAARCKPEDFATYFPEGHAECMTYVVVVNCEATAESQTPCQSPYARDRLSALDRCHDDMTVLACVGAEVPNSCLEAFL